MDSSPSTAQSLPPLKLPRKLEADPRREQIEKALAKDLRPLWEKGSVTVAHVPFSPGLENSLVQALHFKHLERGLENIEQILDREKKGISALQEKLGTTSAHRVSRLLIAANDGSERFYRACESALLKHGDRVLMLLVDVPCARFGMKLFGPEKPVKAVMVSDRDAVSNVLVSLADAGSTAPSRS